MCFESKEQHLKPFQKISPRDLLNVLRCICLQTSPFMSDRHIFWKPAFGVSLSAVFSFELELEKPLTLIDDRGKFKASVQQKCLVCSLFELWSVYSYSLIHLARWEQCYLSCLIRVTVPQWLLVHFHVNKCFGWTGYQHSVQQSSFLWEHVTSVFELVCLQMGSVEPKQTKFSKVNFSTEVSKEMSLVWIVSIYSSATKKIEITDYVSWYFHMGICFIPMHIITHR